MEIRLPQNVNKLIEKLEEAGFPSYIVGGCVRDSMLGRDVADWDICTAATPEEMITVFEGRKILETGIKHGTITVFEGDVGYEITTFRIEGAYSDNRHPDEVKFVRNMEEDIKRRDFTVNAMAYNSSTGLIDLVGGVQDLEKKIIRCVGNPDERFAEDGLRILRAPRFSSTLDFSIEEETSRAIFRNKDLLMNIAAERIRVELDKLLCGDGVEHILRKYAEIIAVFIPEIVPMFGFQQINKYHYLDVWEHTIKTLINIPPEPALRLTMLLHDISKPECFNEDENGCGHFTHHPQKGANKAVSILSRLKYDKATIDLVHNLVFSHDGLLIPEPKYVKKWLNKASPEVMHKVLLVKSADAYGKCEEFLGDRLESLEKAAICIRNILEEEQCFKLRDMAVNGRDLLDLGIAQGEYIGILLDRLLKKVIDEEVPNEKAALLAEARTMINDDSQTEKKENQVLV